jgi:mRNA-degrading endonuclease RelE of RelBE toxin-antitoxin system
MRILASEQVQHWLTSLPPETKKRIRAELRLLAAGKAEEVKALRGELDGYLRLRIGDYRIIYHVETGPTIKLDYADIRETIYGTFLQILTLNKI